MITILLTFAKKLTASYECLIQERRRTVRRKNAAFKIADRSSLG
jgi:hypothetical protein